MHICSVLPGRGLCGTALSPEAGLGWGRHTGRARAADPQWALGRAGRQTGWPASTGGLQKGLPQLLQGLLECLGGSSSVVKYL